MGVAAKIAKVMEEVSRIPKAGYNKHFDYAYVTEADLVDHLRPIMAKVGLVLVPAQHERVEREVETRRGLSVVTAIHHTFLLIDTDDEDSYVEVRVWGEGQDTGDKGSYKAFTGAMKYALMKLFLVSTGDDPERATHEPIQPEDRIASTEGVAPVRELMDEPIRFGKHKGKTWSEVLEVDRQYVEWAVGNAKKMGVDLRATLVQALTESESQGTPDPTSEATESEAEGEVPGGTAPAPSPASANQGQIKALKRLFGTVMIEIPAENRQQIEAVLSDEKPREDEVVEWSNYCSAFKADLDAARGA